jgi:ABC-2 type transport system ATP-binding protein
MEEAEVLSDRLAIMDGGRFIAYDAPKTIVQQYGGASICIIKGAGTDTLQILVANGFDAEKADGDVQCRIQDRSSLPKLVRLLEDNKLDYTEIQMKRSTLEDVFLKLTGKRIGEDEVAEPSSKKKRRWRK